MFIHKPTRRYFTSPPPFVQTHMSFEVVEFWIKELRIAASIGRRWQRQRSSSLFWERLCYCWCRNQIWRQEGGKTLKDISQRVLMSSLFPAVISAATTSWKISFGLGNLQNKCGNLQNTGQVWMEQVLEVSEEEFAVESHFNIAMALIWSGERGLRCRNMIE